MIIDDRVELKEEEDVSMNRVRYLLHDVAKSINYWSFKTTKLTLVRKFQLCRQ